LWDTFLGFAGDSGSDSNIGIYPQREVVMRTRAVFTVFARKLESGRRVYYYQTYDDKGFRTPLYSTGQMTKTAAVAFCMERYRAGKLIPTKEVKVKVPAFAKFAEGWWDFDTCNYLLRRTSRRPMSKSTAAQGASTTKNHLLPRFGEMKLDEIKSYDVDLWLSGFQKRGFSNATGNNALKFLKIMLEEAKLQGFIKSNPCVEIKFLPEEGKDVEILTPEEVRALFPADWSSVWADETHCILNKLAACTGMRIGELLGLRGEYVFNGYITVAAQHGRYGYGDTKTHKTRNITIPKVVENDLLRLKDRNGAGYLFSKDGGGNPVSRTTVYKTFFAALDKIGIGDVERRKRKLSVHGWRHFLNTTLLMANVPDSKVMSITGHASKKMKEKYTHFDTTKFTEVIGVQEKLLLTN
jgi:integrase